MKIITEFNSNEELLSFINFFSNNAIAQSQVGVQDLKENQINIPTNTVSTVPITQQTPINPIITQPIPQVTVQTNTVPNTPPMQQNPQNMQPNQVVPTTQVPVSTQTYTMDQLAVAATQIVDAGRRVELVNLLTSFGVQALTALPKEQYGAFATKLREMGAKI